MDDLTRMCISTELKGCQLKKVRKLPKGEIVVLSKSRGILLRVHANGEQRLHGFPY